MQSPDYSRILFPSSVLVTEQEINISSLSDTQKQFYIDLFKEIIDLYIFKQKPRMIVGLAGPAGSGKSVTVAILHKIAKQLHFPFRLETVGIDAFHHKNDFLLTHTIDGEPLKAHKGRFDTYDVKKLAGTLQNFSVGKEVSLPLYSRKIHDPIESAVAIRNEEPALLLVEGLWILYDKAGWENVGKLIDFSIFVEADNERVRQGVLERHVRGGRTLEDASTYYEANEAKNFNLIMQTKGNANKVIHSYYDIE